MGLTHVDESGKAKMVDVSGKDITQRRATAQGRVLVGAGTLAAIRGNRTTKGDVLATARIAAIMAAKKTADLIPLCHPVPITDISVDFEFEDDRPAVVITVTVTALWLTGVEMEAIVGVLAAAATVYDMIKGMDRSAVITDVALIMKTGGKSGTYIRER